MLRENHEAFIPIPDDDPDEEIVHSGRRKLEIKKSFSDAAMSLHPKRVNSSCSKQDHQSIFVESQRIRLLKSTQKIQKDHNSDRGHVSMSHCHMVHTPIPRTTVAMTIHEAKAAVDKEWTKLHKLRAWDESTVTSKAKVIRQAKLEGKTVHVATFMDL